VIRYDMVLYAVIWTPTRLRC